MRDCNGRWRVKWRDGSAGPAIRNGPRGRDGSAATAKLATDIYLPARNGAAVEGRFPIVLSRTPYGKGGTVATAKYFVPRGYVVVGQDTRGRGGSEGIWHWMTDDRQDGYDAIEWLARQPWSDGKVGMMGCSYIGRSTWRRWGGRRT